MIALGTGTHIEPWVVWVGAAGVVLLVIWIAGYQAWQRGAFGPKRAERRAAYEHARRRVREGKEPEPAPRAPEAEPRTAPEAPPAGGSREAS